MRRRAWLLAVGLSLLGTVAASADARPPAWKLFLNDAYSGRLDHEYSCATAREAMKHLPAAAPDTATEALRLIRAYRRKVC